jgi:murein DD-endopeptidase
MRLILALLFAGLIGGCASVPERTANGTGDERRAQVAAIAEAMEGRPYRYGGTSPNGFDCSGLVRYAYEQAGLRVPRTTRDQFRAVRPQYVAQLQPGDVIFFRLRSARPSHVGIYLGDGEFIHALNADHPVRIDRIDTGYWQKRIVRAGSFRI